MFLFITRIIQFRGFLQFFLTFLVREHALAKKKRLNPFEGWYRESKEITNFMGQWLRKLTFLKKYEKKERNKERFQDNVRQEIKIMYTGVEPGRWKKVLDGNRLAPRYAN